LLLVSALLGHGRTLAARLADCLPRARFKRGVELMRLVENKCARLPARSAVRAVIGAPSSWLVRYGFK
jgi:hypothetical protein